MTDERIPTDLERRLSSSLHAAAPHPAPDLADRLLRRTAAAPQRRRWSGIVLASVLAGAAAVVLAVVIGLQLGGLLPRGVDVGGDPSASASAPSPSASAAPESDAATVRPSPSDDGFPNGLTCSNEELGFGVAYPAGWWANEAVVPEDPALTPIAACRYFAEEPVDLQPNAGLPRGIAIIVDAAQGPPGEEPASVEVVDRRETEVDGRPAIVQELRWTEDTAFQRAGDRRYAYRISLPDGEAIEFSTDTSISGADADTYAAHRDVLDRMMETLDLPDP